MITCHMLIHFKASINYIITINIHLDKMLKITDKIFIKIIFVVSILIILHILI